MKNWWRNTVGILLATGVASVSAETETGLINLTTFATGSYASDGVLVGMKTPSSTLTGLCGGSGMFLPLNGDASKAAYSSLLAAVVSGKSVVITYQFDASANTCLLNSARVE